MKNTTMRVRFAPSPTGIMHLGNVRTALMNFLFARQKQGTFILRIEDTDPQRNFDKGAQHIISDLQWLNLDYDEGPGQGGPYAPYFQSERTALYSEYLKKLQTRNLVYPCFCTIEELEKKRIRARALKKTPRYDRTCLAIGLDEQKRLMQTVPYIWRIKLPDSKVSFTDMARGMLHHDVRHFSDFALTRPDGSFTFVFANAIDDMVMKITHVIRGEDHLSTTAQQIVIYDMFQVPIPIFWHIPIMCNTEGKKLSKRDFGFSLEDLQKSGFLPEAINNYLTIIGGSFPQEIMDQEELIKVFPFDTLTSTGHVRYDVEKLRWINHKWINKLSVTELTQRCMPFLTPELQKLPKSKLETLISVIQPNLITLEDCSSLISFYVNPPSVSISEYEKEYALIKEVLGTITSAEHFHEALQTISKHHAIKPSHIFGLVRLVLTGKKEGVGIKDLSKIFSLEELKARFR